MARKRSVGLSPPTVGLAVFIAALVGFFVGRATGPKVEKKQGPDAVAVAEAETKGEKLKLDPSPAMGTADAPVIIYEVSDFQ